MFQTHRLVWAAVLIKLGDGAQILSIASGRSGFPDSPSWFLKNYKKKKKILRNE